MKIVITSPVQHDGKTLEIGDVVDLPKNTADALVQAGAALESGGRKVASETPAAD